MINALATIMNFTFARREQTHYITRDSGLSTARLTYDTQGFAGLNVQGHAVDGMYKFLLTNETPTLKLDLI